MLIGQVFVFLDPDGSMQVKPSETLKWLKKTSLVMSDKTTLNDQQRPDVSCKAFTEYITQGSQRKNLLINIECCLQHLISRTLFYWHMIHSAS